MSLRYRLSKERFQGKKLPPKIRTNEDHVSPDQRGNLSSADMEFKAIEQIKSSLKNSFEGQGTSRRGLISSLNFLKDYSEKSDSRARTRQEETKPRTVTVKMKDPEDETETAASGATTLELPALEEDADQPQKGFFRRAYERFFPPLEDKPQKPAKKKLPQPGMSAGEPMNVEDGAFGAVLDPQKVQAFQATTQPVANEADEENEEENEARPEEDFETSRRNLIRQGIHFFAKPAFNTVQNKIDKVNQTVDKITKRVPLLRPPGAISERQFLQACTRCDKCANACPKDAIQKVPKKMGFLIMDTPYIDPMKVPCVMCNDLPCISACPDGALLPVPGGRMEAKMGYAILDKKKCQAYGHIFCQQCVIDCPIPGAIVQKNDLPVIKKDICTGCGVCVRSCSTVNIPVAIKIKPQMVIEWQERKRMMEETRAEIEAREKREAAQKKDAPAVAEEPAPLADSPEDMKPDA